ncbi:MAG: homoserine dehydrogenase [Lachnospiraceae bacterium]
MINVAVLGYGTVGSGVVEVIHKNQEIVNKKAKDEVCVKYVLDLREFEGDPVQKILVHDVNVILEDTEVDVICETMGGVEPAYTFTKKALMSGKSVCTSNKELVANHGSELIKIAHEHNCNYLFEASVGGGIPIIRPLNASLTPEKIIGITGILNGTTNYILSKMAAVGANYEDVLQEAQQKGYAEKNPSADVDGLDAGRKIAILSSLMYGKTVHYEDIYTEGITKITAADFVYAKKMGTAIKLLAISKDLGNEYFAMVAPFMIQDTNPLFHVNDVFNGILVHGNMLGNTMYYGAGAGKLPTASAVVGDVIDCARHIGKSITCFWDEEPLALTSIDNARRRFFIRIQGKLMEQRSQMESLFGQADASDELKVIEVPEYPEEFAVVTPVMSEKEYKEKVAQIRGFISMIRMEA